MSKTNLKKRLAVKDLTVRGQHAVCAASNGLVLAGAQATVTGTLAVATGLSAITSAVVALGANAALTGHVVTSTFSGGTLTIAVWKPTTSGDGTPIAATAAVVVDWVAIGTV